MFVFFAFLSLYILILTVISYDFNKIYEYFTINSSGSHIAGKSIDQRLNDSY